MTENWLPVAGYEGLYSVSDQGRVRSEPRIISNGWRGTRHWEGRILSTNCPALRGRQRRYPSVTLYRNNVGHKFRVQYLVTEAFIGPRPPDLEVLHYDDDPNNNRLSNLRYGTHAENKADEVRNTATCRSGRHKWNDENTYIRPDKGTRQCRACQRERKAIA